MMDYKKQLSQFTSAEISDAMDALRIESALLDIQPIQTGIQLIGPAYTIGYTPYQTPMTEFKNAANYIDDVPKDAVIVIDNQGRKDCTVWGEILTQMALYKEIAGTVVYGAVRDIEYCQLHQYPLFATAVFMRSGKNRVYKVQEQQPLKINNIDIHPGDIIFADQLGVLVIPVAVVSEVISKAMAIHEAESNIKKAIVTGMSLENARAQFQYAKPWLQKPALGENES